ncbi:MAG: metallophosphoesterase [Armatimonadetes bacterium]|nr:metallophosphoesterase [Armatimonadota bacterium]
MELSRRNILALLGSAPLLSLPGVALASQKRKVRISFLTDLHLPARNEINDRAQRIFKKASDCDLFLFGGDNLMSIDHQPEAEKAAQFNNWSRFLAHNVSKPHLSVVGNHDIEMWDDGDQSHGCGKRRAMEAFGMKHRYWEERVGGWRIIGLDTVHRNRVSYYGHVDREQMAWLRSTLEADKKTPTMVVGHMPLLSVTPLADLSTQARPMSMPVSFCSQVGNAREVINLFRQVDNVKLCLSGHTHMVDRCEFDGTTYLCGGSVSGSWWNGPHQGFAPSYTSIELMQDGTFTTQTVRCG